MKYNYAAINEYLSAENHVMLQWNDGDSLELEEGGTFMNHMSLFIVNSGTMVLQTDCRTWEAHPGDMMFFAYDKTVKVVSRSADYSSVGMFFSRNFWNDILMNINPSIYAAKLYPVIPVSARQNRIISDFIYEIRSFKERGREDNDPLVINCILGLFYHLGKTYEKSISEKPANSHVRMLSDFADLLNASYREHRDVVFYAQGLNLSPSYFSALILQVTGYTAGACIRKYVALKVCQSLKDSQKSIKEIAISLNFKSASHFCRFFREQMGVSPEEYRRNFMKRLEDFE